MAPTLQPHAIPHKLASPRASILVVRLDIEGDSQRDWLRRFRAPVRRGPIPGHPWALPSRQRLPLDHMPPWPPDRN